MPDSAGAQPYTHAHVDARPHQDRPYLIVATGLALAMLAFTLNQQWAGDFWVHMAAVRELARQPWTPQHPFYALQAPSPILSPYILIVALVSRTLDIQPLTAFAAFGVFNGVALLVSLRLFVGALLGPRAALYTLLFMLVLWGRDPWRYSGFFHLNMLGWGLSYPSTFSWWLTLLSFYALLRYCKGSHRWGVLVVIAAPMLLLTHQITALVFACGIIAFSAGTLRRQPSRVIALAVAVALVSAAAILSWPYYPWLSLVTHAGPQYSVNNVMFDGVLQRIWPAFLLMPLLIWRWRQDALDGLSWFVVGLAAIYLYGAFTNNGLLGRVIAAMVFGLHMVLADFIVGLEARLTSERRAKGHALRAAVVLVLAIGLLNMAPGLIRYVPRSLVPATVLADPRLERTIDVLRPLADRIGDEAVVLTTGNYLPHLTALTGKIVAHDVPEPFVPDSTGRHQALNLFFADATTEERRSIIQRYNVDYIAVDRREQAFSPALSELGSIVYDDGRVVLLKVAPEHVGAALLGASPHGQGARALLLNPDAPDFSQPAPAVSVVRLDTSKGTIDIEVTRDWAPRGADRFVALARHGYFDAGRFFRITTGRWAQFGINGDPAIAKAWRTRTFPDDPFKQSNVRGTVAFAFGVPNGRTTQVFINLTDNSPTHDKEPFTPFGRVVRGMEVVDALNNEYGEGPGGIRAGKQDAFFEGGNAWLMKQFPRLDYIRRATIVTR